VILSILCTSVRRIDLVKGGVHALPRVLLLGSVLHVRNFVALLKLHRNLREHLSSLPIYGVLETRVVGVEIASVHQYVSADHIEV